MRAKRRTFTAYFVEPFKQIRFGLHVVAVCLSFVVLLGWLYARAFSQQYQQVIDIFAVVDTAELVSNDIFIRNAIIIGATLLALVLSTIFVVVRRTHKMYGPMVSIHRFVAEMRRGNYAVRIAIRESDDFQLLVEELNQLAETLHERHPDIAEKILSQPTDLDSDEENLEAGVVTIGKKSPSRNKPTQAS
jgi:nitrogen fixation/metabolism regulation signal transduction histidine kinase